MRWALVREPTGGLGAPISPVDLLVHPDDVESAEEALRSRAFVRIPRPEHETPKFIRYDENSRRWLRIRVVTTIGFGPRYPLPPEEESHVFERTQVVDGVRRLDPDTTFWLTLWDRLSLVGHIDERTRETLLRLYPEVDPRRTTARRFAEAFGDAAIPRKVAALLRSGNWAVLEDLGRLLHQREENLPAPVTTPLTLRDRLRRAIRNRRTASRRRGFTVAVIGPEGAGKSTLVTGIARTVPLPAWTIDMGIDEGTLGRIARLPVPGFRLVLLAFAIWRRYQEGRHMVAQGRLVIFDRYVYDAAAPTSEPLSGFAWRERQIAARLLPRPDFLYVLDAPGAVMAERGRGGTAGELEDRRWFFRQMRQRLPGMVLIDATRDRETVLADAVAPIWRAISSRWDAG